MFSALYTVAFIGFDASIYNVSEDDSYVMVCITLTDGQSLATSSAMGNFSINTTENNAKGMCIIMYVS